MSIESSQEQISETIMRLRSLSQVNVQPNWRYCDKDLSIAQATHPVTWQNWSLVELNAREHVAWSKGKHVRWLGWSIVVPQHLKSYPLQGLTLRLALTWWAEFAQIFVNGKLVQEGDLFDCSTRLLLSPVVVPGEEIAVALRLISPGHDDGALVRSVCLYEAPTPTHPLEPGFIADELVVLQTYLQTFAPEKLEVVADAIAQIAWSALSSLELDTFNQSLSQLRDRLLPFSDLLKQRTILLLGHAHLDMAWLWPVDDTWRAAERTFESVLNLQKDFPELRFCHSTPALYDWLEQNRPNLFQRIQQQVETRCWEPVGGLWVEPELNIISGESIVRHVLYGQRYVQEKFGRLDRIAWLPDSFGFNWQLPQILKQGGIDYFVTQKLRWNDTTKFPYDLFGWQSPDSTQILSLMSAQIGEGIDPVKMAAYACDWETKTGMPIALWLPGVGDHGGGPTRDMLELVRRWQQSPFLPELKFTTALEYLQELERRTGGGDGEGKEDGGDKETKEIIQNSKSQTLPPTPNPQPPTLPVWNSDLYLEFHRGCYTTHALQKLRNRNAEQLLYQAELWAALATIAVGATYPKLEIESAWKKTLFNQFHDILPGSAIPQVFVDADIEWTAVEKIGSKILEESLNAIAQNITLPLAPHPQAQPIAIFNSLNWQRSSVIEYSLVLEMEAVTVYDSNGQTVKFEQPEPGKLLFQADDLPAIGYRVFWICQASTPKVPAVIPSGDFVLENSLLRVTVDPVTGDLASVFDKTNQREALSAPGNQLQAFKDEGQYWDAWNIDPNYAQHPLPAPKLQKILWLERGEVRSRLRVVRQLNQSLFTQDYILESHSPLLKIATQVEWREKHVLIKAAFPLNLESDYATYEIPCGAIQRPTKPETEAEKAQWEVPALHWADLSDGSFGVSLLNDCKYGYDCQGNLLRLTLLRGSEWPDPDADTGCEHHFTYALYPHANNWQIAKTVQQGYELNQPPRVIRLSLNQYTTSKTLHSVNSLLDLKADNLILMAFKQLEDTSSEWVLRCYECQGDTAKLTLRSDLNLRLEDAIDLLERPTDQTKIQGQTVEVHPWTIVSFKVASSKSGS